MLGFGMWWLVSCDDSGGGEGERGLSSMAWRSGWSSWDGSAFS